MCVRTAHTHFIFSLVSLIIRMFLLLFYLYATLILFSIYLLFAQFTTTPKTREIHTFLSMSFTYIHCLPFCSSSGINSSFGGPFVCHKCIAINFPLVNKSRQTRAFELLYFIFSSIKQIECVSVCLCVCEIYIKLNLTESSNDRNTKPSEKKRQNKWIFMVNGQRYRSFSLCTVFFFLLHCDNSFPFVTFAWLRPLRPSSSFSPLFIIGIVCAHFFV